MYKINIFDGTGGTFDHWHFQLLVLRETAKLLTRVYAYNRNVRVVII